MLKEFLLRSLHGVFNKHIVLPGNIKLQNQAVSPVRIGVRLTWYCNKMGKIFWGSCETGAVPVRFNVQWGVPWPDASNKSPVLIKALFFSRFEERAEAPNLAVMMRDLTGPALRAR